MTLLNDTISSLKSDRVILSTTNTSTDSIMFGKDSSNNYGYIIPGADTVTPFNNSIYRGISSIGMDAWGENGNASTRYIAYHNELIQINEDTTIFHTTLLINATFSGDQGSYVVRHDGSKIAISSNTSDITINLLSGTTTAYVYIRVRNQTDPGYTTSIILNKVIFY